MGALLIVVMCHGVMWTLARVAEGRWLEWSKQYTAFVYGDLLLALAVGFALWVNQRIGLPDAGHWINRPWWHVPALVLFAAFAVWRWAINDYPNYSVGQSASPTKLYHDTLFITVAYLAFVTIAPLIGRSWLVLVPLALLAGWFALGAVVDAKDGWKADYAHVDVNWPAKDFVMKYLEPSLGKHRNVPA